MTRPEFLLGQSFKIKGTTYKGAETFRYEEGMIVRESRSSIDDTVQYFKHHINVDKVGKVGFKGFTFVFNKKVNVNLRFDDLEIFKG